MEARAVARYVRVSPKKARQVVDLVRGKRVGDALNILHFSPKAAAKPVEKVIRSAVANALNREGSSQVDAEELTLQEIYVDGGLMLKRYRIAARSAIHRIRRRTSHITVIVSDEDEA